MRASGDGAIWASAAKKKKVCSDIGIEMPGGVSDSKY
jgi:hypothetical protein